MTLPKLLKSPPRLFQTITVFCLTLLGSLILTANPASANELSNQFTISLWVKPEGSVANKALVAKAEEIRLVTNGSGNPLCQVKATSWQTAVTSSTALPLNDWSHVTCVYDKSTLRIFVNGVQTGSQALTVTVDSTSNVFKIGQDDSSGTTYGDLMGVVDNFLAYDYARTPQQIVEDMNAGHPPPGSPIGSPLVHFKFDEGYGTVANNAGSGGSTLNGTLTNMSSPATATSGWSNNGKLNKALNFDGSNDYVGVPNGGGLNNQQSATISMWVMWIGNQSYYTSTYGSVTGRQKGGSFSNQIIGLDAADPESAKIIWRPYGAFGSPAITSTVSPGNNMWRHIVITYSSGNHKMYVDGVLNGTSSITGTIGNDSSILFTIGAWKNIADLDPGGWASASIDEVKIYTSALTDDQVKAEYNMGKATVLGALSTTATSTASNASDRSYCPPGDNTGSCGPVAEWKFDENTGTTTVYDTSGNANHGTMNGGMTNANWVPGKVGSALSFDGIDDTVNFTENSIEGVVNGASAITLTSWVKLNSLPADASRERIINGWVADSSTGFSLNIYDDSGLIEVGGRSGSSDGFQSTTSTETLTTGTWNYLVGILDFANDQLILYLNGKLIKVASVTFVNSTFTKGTMSSSYKSSIGGISGGNIDGSIDQVRIYNYARTPAQIAWDYNRGKPVAHYKLDECSGTTIHSANDPHNSALNGTWSGSGGSQTSVGDCSTSGTAWGNGATGKLNASLNFDGTDDRVLVSQAVTQPNFSYSFWMKPSSLPGSSAYIISEGVSYTNINYVTLNSAGNLDFRIFSSQIATNNNPISAGNWYHIIGTYDGTNGRLYINGQLVKQEAASKNGSPDRFAIGGGTSGTNYFSGQIDDVQIFSYALTPQQIQTIMNSGAIRYGE